MKKLLISTLVTGVLAPVLALATSNDVALTTNVDLSVNSITLDVLGSDAAIESLRVDSGNFSATLQSGSFLKVSPATNNQLIYDILYAGNQAASVNYVCTSATSTLEVSAVASTTLTVTPSSSICADTVTAASSGSSKTDERSGGGGGGGADTTTVVAPVTTLVIPTTPNAEAIAAIKSQLIILIQELIGELIKQLQAEIQAAQVSGSY